MHLHPMGKPIIVLDSVQAAVDPLDKRSANYSGRPAFPLFEEYGSLVLAERRIKKLTKNRFTQNGMAYWKFADIHRIR